MFGRSIKSLRAEVAELQSEADARAMELVGKGINSDELVQELMPLNGKIVALRDEIRTKTPWKELVARRDDVQRKLKFLPGSALIERSQLSFELSDLNRYLEFNRFDSRRPLTLKALLIFVAIIIAMVLGPPMIVDWLAP